MNWWVRCYPKINGCEYTMMTPFGSGEVAESCARMFAKQADGEVFVGPALSEFKEHALSHLEEN